MIKSKADLKYYIECDDIARFGHKATVKEIIAAGIMRKYEVTLRRAEYNENCRGGVLKKIFKLYYHFRFQYLGEKTGWFIPINTFGPGLCVVHIGPVIINHNCRFGCNCRIQAMVNIGANSGENVAPIGGDNIYFGPGAKIFGNIELGSNIAIGANAVVNKSFTDSGVTIAGVPARIVSNKHGSEKMIKNIIVDNL